MKKIKTEIIVAGGGTAGCAAAISAARAGHKVILLEKMTVCGGLATAGNVFIYEPLCDGYGKQVLFGLTEELLLSSVKYGPGAVNEEWKNSKTLFDIRFNPASFILVIDELLKEAGVEVWFDTVVTSTIKDENKLSAIECYNKSGFHQIEADCFIDATGDADLAFAAGNNCNIGTNRMTCWTLDVNPKTCKTGLLGLSQGRGKSEDNMDGISGKMISEYTMRSRQILLDNYKKKWSEKEELNRSNYYPAVLPTMPNIRKTRAVTGTSMLDDDNYWTDFEDSVGITSARWGDKSKLYSIPFGALVPNNIDNLLVAGRCIDSRGYAWEKTRLIPICALTGDIAGIAASLSLKSNKSIQNLSIEKLQKELTNQGHIINFKEAYGENWKDIAKERMLKLKNNQPNENNH